MYMICKLKANGSVYGRGVRPERAQSQSRRPVKCVEPIDYSIHKTINPEHD